MVINSVAVYQFLIKPARVKKNLHKVFHLCVHRMGLPCRFINFYIFQMLTEAEARALGAKIVAASKETAHVDTGYLKRSIAFTYVRQVMIFRQVFYGVYYENSKLEKYINQYIPSGQQWKIILTDMGGVEIEVGRTQSGRAVSRVIKPYEPKQTTKNINRLIEISRARRKKEEEDNG
jgi:hypothetical protein